MGIIAQYVARLMLPPTCDNRLFNRRRRDSAMAAGALAALGQFAPSGLANVVAGTDRLVFLLVPSRRRYPSHPLLCHFTYSK